MLPPCAELELPPEEAEVASAAELAVLNDECKPCQALLEPRCFSSRPVVAVVTGFFAQAVLLGTYFSTQTLVPALTVEFGASRSVTAAVASTLIFSTTSAMIFAGGLVERYGVCRTLVIGCVFFVAGLLIDALATDIHGWFVGVLVTGVGVGLAFLASTQLIHAHTPARRRGLCMGLSLLGAGVGAAAMNTLVAVLIAELGLRLAMLVVAGICAVACCGLVAASCWLEQKSASKPAAGRSLCGGWRWFRVATWRRLASGMFLLLFGYEMPFVALKQLALDLGVEEEEARLLPVVLGLCNGFGRVFGGAVGDLVGNYVAVMAVMAFGCGVTMLLLPACGTFSHLVAFAAAYGILAGGRVGTVSCVCMQFFGADHVASAYGTLSMAFVAPSMLGPLVAGLAHDRTGSYDPAMYAAAGTTFGACAVFASLIRGASTQTSKEMETI